MSKLELDPQNLIASSAEKKKTRKQIKEEMQKKRVDKPNKSEVPIEYIVLDLKPPLEKKKAAPKAENAI